MLQPSVVLSVLALAFTLFSFWWMQWRPGKLVVTEPRSYAAVSTAGKIVFEIPLVFFNKGATPIIVHNLRVKVAGIDEPLLFIAVVQKLGNHDDRRFASQFAVRQQEAVTLICEFQALVAGFFFERRNYQAVLEWAQDSSRKWKQLLDFTVHVTDRDLQTINSAFIVHDNWPESPSSDTV